MSSLRNTCITFLLETFGSLKHFAVLKQSSPFDNTIRFFVFLEPYSVLTDTSHSTTLLTIKDKIQWKHQKEDEKKFLSLIESTLKKQKNAERKVEEISLHSLSSGNDAQSKLSKRRLHHCVTSLSYEFGHLFVGRGDLVPDNHETLLGEAIFYKKVLCIEDEKIILSQLHDEAFNDETLETCLWDSSLSEQILPSLDELVESLCIFTQQNEKSSLPYQEHSQEGLPNRSLLAQFFETHCRYSKERYLEKVRKAQALLKKGEAYQINLTQPLSIPLAHPFSLRNDPLLCKTLTKLLTQSESECCLINKSDDSVLLSLSPELFIAGMTLEGKATSPYVLLSKPIKGTLPRGRTYSEDSQNRKALSKSTKDCAELTMIVDLIRNDMAAVGDALSISVPEYLQCYEYDSVFHLISTVKATFARPPLFSSIITALFPCGSITGAPKKAAMNIIHQLEENIPRSFYCGSVFSLGDDGSLHANVVIRSALIKGKVMHYHTGGGITVESDPEQEYEELITKCVPAYKLSKILISP